MGRGMADKIGTEARRRGCHFRFVLDMALAFGGFTLIWGPKPWLMYFGAFASFAFTFGMAYEAWKLAAEKRLSVGR